MSTSSEYTIHLPAAVTIGVSSTSDLMIGPDEELLLGAYLPGLSVARGLATETDWHVSHIESGDQGLRQGASEVELKDSWQGRFPTDLPHLLYGIARGCWIRRNLFPVHAACVRSDGLTTLLPGHSGTGKSSVALRLAREYGHEILSGNTTLVDVLEDGVTVRAGTRTMTLRTTDYAKCGVQAGCVLSYGDRTAFRLGSERSTDSTSSAIGRIALIRLSDSENQIRAIEPISALHRLYPVFMDTVHQDVVVCGGKGTFTSNDATGNRRYLARSLRSALQQIPITEITGTSPQVAREVAA